MVYEKECVIYTGSRQHLQAVEDAIYDATAALIGDMVNRGDSNARIYHILEDLLRKNMTDCIVTFNEGNQSRSAEVAGVNRATMRTLMERFGHIRGVQ